MRKIIKITILTLILAIIYIYMLVITNLPDKLVIFKGENIKFNTLYGLDISLKDKTYEAMFTSSSIGEQTFNDKGKTTLTASLFNINIKDIEVNILDKAYVVPIGKITGIKLYTKGVLVVGMSEIEGQKPYEGSDIQEGDVITNINEREIQNTTELIECINQSNGEVLHITYLDNGEIKNSSITPVKNENGTYQIGLWVRDSAAGIGTVSFYEPETGNFVALGHGITDIDTSEIIDISSGELVNTKILSVVKGKSGTPGKIQGALDNQRSIGTIYKNTRLGIYGKVTNKANLLANYKDAIQVATRDEIKLGKAFILCSVDDSEKIEEYEIEIEKKFVNNNYDNKSMLIKVTDERLIEKTGGIVQGMSGSPIVQNGKFIGAVTHVIVTNPKEGYAVFGDMLVKQMRTVEEF